LRWLIALCCVCSERSGARSTSANCDTSDFQSKPDANPDIPKSITSPLGHYLYRLPPDFL